MAIRREEYVKLAEQQVKNGSFYVWGGCGNTANWYLQGSRIYNAETADDYHTRQQNTDRVRNFINKRINAGYNPSVMLGFDCSGLVGGLYNKLQNGSWARVSNANTLGSTTYSTKISQSSMLPGDFCHRNGHIGLYAGNGYVIHAKGRDVGVVKETWAASGTWKDFWRPRGWFTSNTSYDYNYGQSTTTPSTPVEPAPPVVVVDPQLKPIATGATFTKAEPRANTEYIWDYIVNFNGYTEQEARRAIFEVGVGANTGKVIWTSFDWNKKGDMAFSVDWSQVYGVNEYKADRRVRGAVHVYGNTSKIFCDSDKNLNRPVTLSLNGASFMNEDGSIPTGKEKTTSYLQPVDGRKSLSVDNVMSAFAKSYSAGKIPLTNLVQWQRVITELNNNGAHQKGAYKRGYECLGWSTMPNAASGSYSSAASVSNSANIDDEVTFYLTWQVKKCAINFYTDATCKTLLPGFTAFTTLGTDDYKYSTGTPVQPGYKFLGWKIVQDDKNRTFSTSGNLPTDLVLDHMFFWFYPSWQQLTYQVNLSYSSSQGTLSKTSFTIHYGESLADALNKITITPAKNYIFDGWYDGNTKITPSSYKWESNKTFTAKFTYVPPPRYDNFYYDIYGRLMTAYTQNGEVGTQFSVPFYPDPMPDKCVWVGWLWNGNYYQGGNNANIISQSRYFYATYRKETYYKVSYNLNGGTYNGSSSISTIELKQGTTLGSALPSASGMSRQGYAFVRWTIDSGTSVASSSTVVNSDITLVAQWEVNTAYITLHYNDDTNKTQNYTLSITSTYYPSNDSRFSVNTSTIKKKGHSYTQWYTDEACSIAATAFTLQKNQTKHFYLGWKRNTYTLYFKGINCSLAFSNKQVEYLSPYGVFPQTTPNTGYRIVGWFKDQNGNALAGNSDIMYDSSATVYCIAEKKQYTITWDWNAPNPGNVAKPTTTLTYNSNIVNIPTPPNANMNIGYDFVGWFDSSGKQITSNYLYAIDGDSTFTAKWQKKTYYVQLYSRPTQKFGNPIPVLYQEKLDKSKVDTPARPRAIFLYWKDRSTGLEYNFGSLMPANNIELEAVWKFQTADDRVILKNQLGQTVIAGPYIFTNGEFKPFKIRVFKKGEWYQGFVDPNDYIKA